MRVKSCSPFVRMTLSSAGSGSRKGAGGDMAKGCVEVSRGKRERQGPGHGRAGVGSRSNAAAKLQPGPRSRKNRPSDHGHPAVCQVFPEFCSRARRRGLTANYLQLWAGPGVLRMNDDPPVHTTQSGMIPPADFTTFMRNYQDMVYSTAVRLLNNEAQAED